MHGLPSVGKKRGDSLAKLVRPEVSITGAVTLTATAFGKMHVCSGTSADYTVGLPAVSGNAGKFIGLRMASGLTKFVTLDGNASELIDGATTRVMWANETAILFCDGSAWARLAGKLIAMQARLSRNTAQSINNTTVTKILLNSEEFDIGGIGDPTTNNRVDIKRPGRYLASAFGRMDHDTIADAKVLQGRILKNGTAVATANSYTPAANTIPIPFLTTVLDLIATDYIEMALYHDIGSATNTITADGFRPTLCVSEIL